MRTSGRESTVMNCLDKCIVGIITLAGFVLGLNGAVVNAAPIEIRLAHSVAADTLKGRAVNLLAKRVAQSLDGKVVIKVFSKGELYTEKNVLQALRNGRLEMAVPSLAKFVRWTPEFQVFSLPYMFKSRAVLHQVIDGEIGAKILQKLERDKMMGLAVWDNGFKHFTNNTKEIKNPKDMEDLVFRIMLSRVLEAQFKAVGAVPMIIPFNRVKAALKNGEVDGQESTWSSFYSSGSADLQKYITETNHGYLGYLLVTNRQFWLNLPTDIRTELEAIIKEVTLWARQQSLELNQQYRQKLLDDKRVHITELSQEQLAVFKKAFEPVRLDYINFIGRDIYDGVEALNNSN